MSSNANWTSSELNYNYQYSSKLHKLLHINRFLEDELTTIIVWWMKEKVLKIFKRFEQAFSGGVHTYTQVIQWKV